MLEVASPRTHERVLVLVNSVEPPVTNSLTLSFLIVKIDLSPSKILTPEAVLLVSSEESMVTSTMAVIGSSSGQVWGKVTAVVFSSVAVPEEVEVE